MSTPLRRVSKVRVKHAADSIRDVAMPAIKEAIKLLGPAVAHDDPRAHSLTMHLQYVNAQLDVIAAHLIGPNNQPGEIAK
jgi:hypothetical protein